MFRIIIVCVMLLIPLNGCGAMSAMSMLTPGPSVGVDTEVVTGEKEEQYGIIDKSESQTYQSASTIQNIEQRVGWPTMLLIVLLAGWAIPDPMTMGRGCLAFLRILIPWK